MAVESRLAGYDFEDFIKSMISNMRANRHKGDKWVDCPPDYLVLEIYEHTAKLRKAINEKNPLAIEEYAADVANLAHMTLQACQGGVPKEWHDFGSCG